MQVTEKASLNKLQTSKDICPVAAGGKLTLDT
jgi:hypothetical protein